MSYCRNPFATVSKYGVKFHTFKTANKPNKRIFSDIENSIFGDWFYFRFSHLGLVGIDPKPMYMKFRRNNGMICG